VKLPGSEEWVVYQAGDSFVVEKGLSFAVRAIGQTAYLCLYK
jgi:uncharacterized protein YaiE (UPF0345 family)